MSDRVIEMKLLIVIVNYRTPHLVVDCLRSLAAEVAATPGTRVIVADNASGDYSVEQISSTIQANGWRSWATVMPLAQNGGFACGNNAVIAPALKSEDPPEYVLLLNPDTIVKPGAVIALLHFMDTWPAVGIAGSRLEHPDGAPQRSAFRFPSVAGEVEGGLRLGFISRLLERHVVAPPAPETRCPVDWVAGASMIVRRGVFDAVGLLDEAFFMYYEEVDFCRRARQAGWQCWYVPASRVIHLIGKASGVTDTKTAVRHRRPAYWFASRRRYFLKHLGPWRTFLADVGWACGYGLFAIRRAILLRPSKDPRRLWWDFVRYNFITSPPSREPGLPVTDSPTKRPAEPTRKSRRLGTTGDSDVNSALWAALKRDVAREKRMHPDAPLPPPPGPEALRPKA